MPKDDFPPLTDQQLNLVKGLFDRSWQSFDERRRHEYHLSYLFWAAYALFIAAALGVFTKDGTGQVFHFDEFGKCTVLIAFAAFAVAHGLWIWGAARAQSRDMRIADFYGTAIRRNLGIEDLFSSKFPDGLVRYDCSVSMFCRMTSPNHLAELIVTTVMATAAIVVLWYKC